MSADKKRSEGSTSRSIEPKPLGPNSYMWKDFGSYLYHFMLPQAFVLQSAHPIIDMAITKEKKYLLDPWGRAVNSTALLWPVVYARPENAIEKGRALRELHRHIKGEGPNGKRYYGLDPEAYSWVHITGFDASTRMYECFGTPLNPEQRAQVFSEWKQMGSMLGIRDADIPQTEAEYWKKFDEIVIDRLEYGEALKDLLDPGYFSSYPKPKNFQYIPNALWKLAMLVPGWLLHKICIATLPEKFRYKLNIPLNKRDVLIFKSASWFIRKLYPLLPEKFSYIPLALRARRDARAYPEAYRESYQEPSAATTEEFA
ncbi:hypothetical protein A9Q99_21390 [Gammaproteobacteria bacterium 45_16_T64]|nr:hypothetical protein A9Q99_21390 [Gammaproteobacteria bacterium 45_16_T64]